MSDENATDVAASAATTEVAGAVPEAIVVVEAEAAPDAPADGADAAADVDSPSDAPDAPDSSPPADTGKRSTIEAWRAKHATPDWLFAGTKLGKGWAVGQELTEEAYLEGVTWARDVASR